MTTQQIKSEFHKLIDEFDDKNVLVNFYEAILEYRKKDKSVDIIDDLSERQKQRLMDSIEQADKGNTMSNAEVKDEIQKWITK